MPSPSTCRTMTMKAARPFTLGGRSPLAKMNDGQVERCHVGHNDMASLVWTDVPQSGDRFRGLLGRIRDFTESRGDGLLSIDPHPGPASVLPRSFCCKVL